MEPQSCGSHLLEIDEQFCQCPICLQQYTEPKLLPCIHRYCRNCLEQLILKNPDAHTITCPECRGKFEVPEKGVDGFKTDFYIKKVIEYIQLQKSLQEEQLRECCDCTKKIKVTAYCFKCNDFLCKDCHNIHVTKKILRDHKQHTLSLEDIKTKNLTLEKLAALKEAPRCQCHPENLSQLCCKTCNNLPICVTCTYGSHENHNIKDVNILATEEKEKLSDQLEMLSQCKERIYEMSRTIDRIRTDLLSNFKEKKEFYVTKYERDVKKTETDMKKMEHSKGKEEAIIRAKKEKDLTEARTQMEKELEEVRKKYGFIFDDIKNKSDAELSYVKENKERHLQRGKSKLSLLKTELKSSLTSIVKRREKGERKLEELSLEVNGIAKRFENFTATAHSILDTGNDWSAVQCIPDICSASQPLSLEMSREFPELESLSQIEIRSEVTLESVSPIDIERTNPKYNIEISGLVSMSDDRFVITGPSGILISHITVISKEGKVLLQKKLMGVHDTPYRYCARLSPFQVVTVSLNNEMCALDVGNGWYNRRDILKLCSWPESVDVSCVATDAVSNTFLVGGCYSKDVYVFTDQLKYSHTLTLSELDKFPHDMAVIGDTLLVCDYYGGRAYAFSMDGSEVTFLQEFAKPLLDGDDWSPFSICTDNNRFAYMLWREKEFWKGSACVVRYSPDCRQIVTFTPVDNDACYITITEEADKTQKLVIATGSSGKLYIHDLRVPLCNETKQK